jgi:hypothetical protein
MRFQENLSCDASELSNVTLTEEQREFIELVENKMKKKGFFFEEKQTIVNTYFVSFYINSRVLDGIGFIFEGTKWVLQEDKGKKSRIRAFFKIYGAIEGKDWNWVPAYGKRGENETYVAITNFVLAKKLFGLHSG